jgi:heptosyltransferase-2
VDNKKFWARVELIKRLKKLAPSQTILLQNAFGAAALAFLAGLPQRRGYARDGRSFLLHTAIPIAPRTRLGHEVFYYLDLLKALGINAPYVAPELKLPSSRLPMALPKGFLLALAPGAAYGEAKRYPAKDFARIAQYLAEQKEIAVVILGGSGEIAAAQEVAENLGSKIKTLNLAGQTNMTEAMAVLRACQLLLTNDSGLAHVGGALGVPVAVLFGPTNPLATGPLARRQLVLLEPVPCAPCRNRQCPRKERICFLGLKPKLVADRFLEFLNFRPLGRPTLFWRGPKPEIQDLDLDLPAVDLTLEELGPNAPTEMIQRASHLKIDLKDSFWLSDQLDFLKLGQKLGGQTILVANERTPRIFREAFSLRPNLAAPDPGRGLEWIADQIKNRP